MPLMIGREVAHIEAGDVLVFDGNGNLSIRRNGQVLAFKLDCGCLDNDFNLDGNINYGNIVNLPAVTSGFSSAVKVAKADFEGLNVVMYEVIP